MDGCGEAAVEEWCELRICERRGEGGFTEQKWRVIVVISNLIQFSSVLIK